MKTTCKQSIRVMFKQIREGVTESKRLELDKMVLENFKKIYPKMRNYLLKDNFQNTPNVSISGYYPTKGETDVISLMKYAKQYSDNTNLSLPLITNTKTREMVFKEWSLLESDLEKGAYGLKVPKKNNNDVDPNLLLTPQVSFDDELNRIGWGYGYCDRAYEKLKLMGQPVQKVGISYEFQKSKELIPKSKYDEPLDIVITDQSVYYSLSIKHKFV